MNRPLLLVSAAIGVSLFGCSGTSTTPPPPPPPPPEVKVEPPPVVPPPVVAPTDRLPPPWGELGLGYGTTKVELVDPGQVLLTAPMLTAATATIPVYTAWEQALTAAGYMPGAPYLQGEDSGEVWSKGDQHLAIARGTTGAVAYVYAADVQKMKAPEDAKATDAAVEALLHPDATPAADPATAAKLGPHSGPHVPEHATLAKPDESDGKGLKKGGKKGGKGKKKPGN